MLAYAPIAGYHSGNANEGLYDVSATNTDLATEGCSDTTDVTLDDLVVGCTLEVLAVGNDSDHGGPPWPDIASFSTISQLKSIVDAHPDTVTVTVTTDPYSMTGNPIGTSTDGLWGFIFGKSDAAVTDVPKDQIMGVNYMYPTDFAATRLIVFIESQP